MTNDPTRARILTEMSLAELETVARGCIWIAEFGPLDQRHTHQAKRDLVVAECERRGRADIVARIRENWQSIA